MSEPVIVTSGEFAILRDTFATLAAFINPDYMELATHATEISTVAGLNGWAIMASHVARDVTQTHERNAQRSDETVSRAFRDMQKAQRDADSASSAKAELERRIVVLERDLSAARRLASPELDRIAEEAIKANPGKHITAIKQIRNITGHGLREAKDAADAARDRLNLAKRDEELHAHLAESKSDFPSDAGEAGDGCGL